MQGTETKIKTTLHVCGDKNLCRTNNFIPLCYSSGIKEYKTDCKDSITLILPTVANLEVE